VIGLARLTWKLIHTWNSLYSYSFLFLSRRREIINSILLLLKDKTSLCSLWIWTWCSAQLQIVLSIWLLYKSCLPYMMWLYLFYCLVLIASCWMYLICI
jgi:hypothetical protein